MAHPLKTDVIEPRVVRQTIDQFTRRVHARIWEMNILEKELAEKMGVARPVVSRAINGNEITVDMFERLTEALEVDAEWWTQPIGRVIDHPPDPFAAFEARVKEIVARHEKN